MRRTSFAVRFALILRTGTADWILLPAACNPAAVTGTMTPVVPPRSSIRSHADERWPL
jgi:hypothetical protein